MLGRLILISAAAVVLGSPANAATIREIVRDAMKTATEAADAGVAEYKSADKPVTASRGAKNSANSGIARYRSLYQPTLAAKRGKRVVPVSD